MIDVQPAEPPGDWTDRAACRGSDPDLFFAERWGNPGDSAAAKAVCARCDVREECLTYALGQPEIFGIWGGLSPTERRAARRYRGAARRPHVDTCGCPACKFRARWTEAAS